MTTPSEAAPSPVTLVRNALVDAKANVYFDGRCISHSLTLPDGSKKSVGVVLPSALLFSTAGAEIMECVAGSCEYKLAGSDTWQLAQAGDSFRVPAQSHFDIRVSEAFHYICHYI